MFLETWQVRQSMDVAEETENDCLIKLKERSKLGNISEVQDVDVAVQKDLPLSLGNPFCFVSFLK